MTRLILASASAIRARLLEQAGVAFEVIPARVDEEPVKQSLHSEPAQVAETLAELKAVRVSASHSGALVLGADQVLAFREAIVSKSADLSQARSVLCRLRGEQHELVGAAVLAKDGVAIWRHVDRAQLWMREFSDTFLDDYLKREGEAALASVGCYRLEGPGAQLFERIQGDYFSILGLPLLPLLAALRRHGVIGS